MIGRSTLYSQTDSVRCFTVKQQNEIIYKLTHRIELMNENNRLSRLISSKDSTITDLKTIIDATNDKYKATLLIYTQEKENRIALEKDRDKYKRRTKFWRGATIVSLGLGVFAYIFL